MSAMATLPLPWKLFMSFTKSSPSPLKEFCCLYSLQSVVLNYTFLTASHRGNPWRLKAKGTEEPRRLAMRERAFYFPTASTELQFIPVLMALRLSYQGGLEHKKLKQSLVPREMGIHRGGDSAVVYQVSSCYNILFKIIACM